MKPERHTTFATVDPKLLRKQIHVMTMLINDRSLNRADKALTDGVEELLHRILDVVSSPGFVIVLESTRSTTRGRKRTPK